MLAELKMLKIQLTLISEYKRISDHRSIHRIFHLNTKLIMNELEMDEAFKSIHQSVITKIGN